MKATKEEAEKAWRDKGMTMYGVPSKDYLDGISDFKSALRADIEESIWQERQVLANPKGYHQNDVLQCKIHCWSGDKRKAK